MGIDINVNRKFIVNGKKYNSIEEMPSDVRKAFETAMASLSGASRQVTMSTKITFNNIEYEGIDAMPQDVRHVYEKVMRGVQTGHVSPELIIGTADKGKGENDTREQLAASRLSLIPLSFEMSFSPKKLIVGLLLAVLLFILYVLL